MQPVSPVFTHIMWSYVTYRPSFSCILTFIQLLLINATVRSNIHSFMALGNISSKLAFLLDKITVSQRENWQPLDKRLSVQFSSVAQSCPTLCDPMNRSTPGLPVHHQLPEFTQTHIHRVSDAIQPSHPLSSPSPPAPKPSQHQSLFQWVNSSHEVAKVREFQL